MGYSLRKEQEGILEKLYRMKSAVIACQAGFGKSIITLHLAKHLQKSEGVFTIFCIPKSARAAFEKEMQTKICEDGLFIHSGKSLEDPSLLSQHKFIFVEFPVLGKYATLLESFAKDHPSYIFVDEAHALCSPKSAQTTYMRLIRSKCIGCFSITASPIMTSIEGLFYLYNFTFPSVRVFQSWFRFRNMYCITQEKTIRMMGRKRIIKEIVGYKNMEELNTLLDKITIKGFVEYDVEYSFLKTSLDKERVSNYNLAAKGLLVTEEEKEWGPRLHDLQRVVDGLPHNDEVMKAYNKARLLTDTLKDIMSRDEGVLIYVEYRDTIDYLKFILESNKDSLNYNRLYVLSGNEKEEKRQQIEQTLLPRDIVIITQAGKQSRNLQRVNNLILYNIPYSLGDILQITGRICRVDTTYSKQHIYMLEVEHTIDSYRIALFKDHLALLDRLLGRACRGTLTCDYVEIDRMKMKDLKKSLLWRMR